MSILQPEGSIERMSYSRLMSDLALISWNHQLAISHFMEQSHYSSELPCFQPVLMSTLGTLCVYE